MSEQKLLNAAEATDTTEKTCSVPQSMYRWMSTYSNAE